MVLSTPSPSVWSPIPQGIAAFMPDNVSLLPLLYSQLVVMATDDEIGAHRNAIEGDLAQSWETPDDTTLVFQLRPNVFWPEAPLMERRRLVASDVRLMHEMYRSLETPQSQAYRAVAGIEAMDQASTIQFNLSEPASYLLNAMTSPDHVVMPPYWTPESAGDFLAASDPVPGTGPFKFRHWGGLGSTWSVTRKNDYFKQDPDTGMQLPYLRSVSGGISQSTRLQESLTGRALIWEEWLDGHFDALNLIEPAELAAVEAEISDALLQVAPPEPGRGKNMIFLQNAARAITDPRVRQALSIAVDRRQLAASWHTGLAEPDCGLNWTFVSDADDPSGFREWPWTEEELGPNFVHDPARARDLLAAAGYTLDAPLFIGLNTGEVADEPQPAGLSLARPQLEQIAGMWRDALGDLIEVQLLDLIVRGEAVEDGRPIRDIARHEDANVTPGTVFGSHPVDPEPSLYWPVGYAPDGSGDAEMDALWDQQRRALDPAHRSELLEQIRARRAEQMTELHFVTPYGMHARRGNIYNLCASYFAHEPIRNPKQLERAWKSTST